MPGRSWRSDVPRAVWLLVALHAALLVSYAIAYPAYQAPDEPQHVDLIVSVGLTAPWPEPGEKTMSRGVLATSRTYNRLPVPLDAGEAPSDAARRPIAQDRGLEPGRGTRPRGYAEPGVGVNHLVQHPPLHYAVSALVLRAVPGSSGWPYDRTVLFLRLVSALFVLPLPLLCYAAARRLTGADVAGVVAAALPLAIPQLTRTGGSVNNDTLLIGLLGGLTVALVHVATGDLTRRTAVVVAVLTGLALLTKGLALFAPPWVLLAYVVGSRGRWRDAFPSLIALGGAFAIGGWWWLRNVVRYGAVQPNGYGDFAPPPPDLVTVPTWETHGSDFVTRFGSGMLFRFWGALGLTEPPQIHWDVAKAATVVVLLGAVLGLVRRPVVGVLLVIPVLGLLAIVGYGSWSHFTETRTVAAAQGRYLYGGVPGLAALAGAGYALLVPRRHAVAVPALAFLAAVAMQWVGIREIAQHYWQDAGALLAHAAVPAAVTVAGWVAVFGLAVASLVELALYGARVRREVGLGAGSPGELLGAGHGGRAE